MDSPGAGEWVANRLGKITGQTEAGLTELAGEQGDGAGAFAHLALVINGAFGGDDELGLSDLAGKIGERGENIEAWLDLTAREDPQAVA